MSGRSVQGSAIPSLEEQFEKVSDGVGVSMVEGALWTAAGGVVAGVAVAGGVGAAIVSAIAVPGIYSIYRAFRAFNDAAKGLQKIDALYRAGHTSLGQAHTAKKPEAGPSR